MDYEVRLKCKYCKCNLLVPQLNKQQKEELSDAIKERWVKKLGNEK